MRGIDSCGYFLGHWAGKYWPGNAAMRFYWSQVDRAVPMRTGFGICAGLVRQLSIPNICGLVVGRRGPAFQRISAAFLDGARSQAPLAIHPLSGARLLALGLWALEFSRPQ